MTKRSKGGKGLGKGTSMPLEGIHNVLGGDGLPLSLLGVSDFVADDVFQEDLHDAVGLLVNCSGDPRDSAPPCQAPDGGLDPPLHVVTENLPVSLGSSLAQSPTTFSTLRYNISSNSDISSGKRTTICFNQIKIIYYI